MPRVPFPPISGAAWAHGLHSVCRIPVQYAVSGANQCPRGAHENPVVTASALRNPVSLRMGYRDQSQGAGHDRSFYRYAV